MTSYVYIREDDLIKIYRGCDLGDSVKIDAYQFPHVSQLKFMKCFVLSEDYEKIKAELEQYKSGDLPTWKSEYENYKTICDSLDVENQSLRTQLSKATELIGNLENYLKMYSVEEHHGFQARRALEEIAKWRDMEAKNAP